MVTFLLHCLLPPAPKVEETLSILQGLRDLASLLMAPIWGHWRTRGPQDVAPRLSPTSLTALASTRSQTSKNVKHVDAHAGGRGRDAYRGRWARGLLPPATPRAIPPTPLEGRKGGTEGGSCAPSAASPLGEL